MAETLNLAAIVCYTASGATSLRAARERPQQPILALTPIPATGRKLSIVWGLHCVLTDDPRNLDDMVAKACRIAYQEEFALPGQQVIITAGVPLVSPARQTCCASQRWARAPTNSRGLRHLTAGVGSLGRHVRFVPYADAAEKSASDEGH